MATSPPSPPSTELLTTKKLKELATQVQLDAKSRQFQFVEPFPSEVQYECPICLEILQDPQIIQCCGNRYCLKCLESLQSKKCPLCNLKGIKFISDKKLERLINQRKVFCLLKKEGCGWTGELCKLMDHLNLDGKKTSEACSFLAVQCDHCHEYMSRQHKEVHESQCNERPSNCTFCGKKVKYNQLKAHHKICSKHPAICPNMECSEAMRPYELATHLSLCPWTPLPCEYEHVGCYFKILRKDMVSHLRENMARHLELAVYKLKKLEEEVKSKGEISYLVISDLPDEALDEHKVKSRFGQFGPVSDVEVLEDWNVAMLEFEYDETYEKVLEASRNRSIKMCKEYVTANPVYTNEQ